MARDQEPFMPLARVLGEAVGAALGAMTDAVGLLVKIFVPTLTDVFREAYGIKKEPQTLDSQIETKLEVALSALQDASGYVSEMERRINEQKASLSQVRATYEHYEQLAAVEKAKADALLRAVDATVKGGVVRERVWSFLLGLLGNVIVFILGVITSERILVWWKALWEVN